jgi:DNA-binding NarL/FixJ family response regulator
VAATRRITAADPQVKVLMVTMFEDDHSVFAAMRAGARGYVLKGAKHDEMLRAIAAVAGGEAIFSPGIAARLIDFFGRMQPARASPAFPELTERELEVLDLLARDYRNADIARALVITPKTVRNHVSNILSKLQAADRAEAAARARDAGLG